MKLAKAPNAYSAQDQAQLRGALERADAENFKKRSDMVLAPGQRLVIPDETTGALYRLKVVGGVLSLVAYP